AAAVQRGVPRHGLEAVELHPHAAVHDELVPAVDARGRWQSDDHERPSVGLASLRDARGGAAAVAAAWGSGGVAACGWAARASPRSWVYNGRLKDFDDATTTDSYADGVRGGWRLPRRAAAGGAGRRHGDSRGAAARSGGRPHPDES